MSLGGVKAAPPYRSANHSAEAGQAIDKSPADAARQSTARGGSGWEPVVSCIPEEHQTDTRYSTAATMPRHPGLPTKHAPVHPRPMAHQSGDQWVQSLLLRVHKGCVSFAREFRDAKSIQT